MQSVPQRVGPLPKRRMRGRLIVVLAPAPPNPTSPRAQGADRGSSRRGAPSSLPDDRRRQRRPRRAATGVGAGHPQRPGPLAGGGGPVVRRRVASLALRLYPIGFRRRYGVEMETLLDASPVGAATVLDLLRGAIVAHLRPEDEPAGVVGVDDRRYHAVGWSLPWSAGRWSPRRWWRSRSPRPPTRLSWHSTQ